MTSGPQEFPTCQGPQQENSSLQYGGLSTLGEAWPLLCWKSSEGVILLKREPGKHQRDRAPERPWGWELVVRGQEACPPCRPPLLHPAICFAICDTSSFGLTFFFFFFRIYNFGFSAFLVFHLLYFFCCAWYHFTPSPLPLLLSPFSSMLSSDIFRTLLRQALCHLSFSFILLIHTLTFLPLTSPSSALTFLGLGSFCALWGDIIHTSLYCAEWSSILETHLQ